MSRGEFDVRQAWSFDSGCLRSLWPFVLSGQVATQDWPQWRGPARDGAVTSFREPSPWPDTLKQQWRIEVGLGYATPLVVGDRLYIFTRQGEEEVMTGARRGHGQEHLAHRVCGAVLDEQRDVSTWLRTEIDADLCQRADFLVGHDEHRHGVRRGNRQAALAEAGDQGAAGLSHGDVTGSRP